MTLLAHRLDRTAVLFVGDDGEAALAASLFNSMSTEVARASWASSVDAATAGRGSGAGANLVVVLSPEHRPEPRPFTSYLTWDLSTGSTGAERRSRLAQRVDQLVEMMRVRRQA